MSLNPNVSLRSHFKSHKCVDIAKLQLDNTMNIDPNLRSKGVCLQILDELEPFITEKLDPTRYGNNVGVLDYFLTNQIVGEKKIMRLMDFVVRGGADTLISIVVDDVSNLQAILIALQTSKMYTPKIGVFIELNCGQNRGGLNLNSVSAFQTLIELAKCCVDNEEFVSFRGLHVYQGK